MKQLEEGGLTREELKKMGRRLLGLFLTLITMLAVLYLISGINQFTGKKVSTGKKLHTAGGSTIQHNNGEVSFRDGDVVFQKIPGELGERISAITVSPVTHCGIVEVDKDEVKIIEAEETVKSTPVKEWIGAGMEKKFALLRDEKLSENQCNDVIKEALGMVGRKYDFQYEWDDDKIYCSELVYKSYKQGAGVELCKFKKLGDLEYRGHEEFIKKLMNGELPLDREMITPVDIFKSAELKTIYSDFN
ncbi:MAG: hypothetical protein LWY06_04575 [Firmicutes bacterium]|nr:hypothetical protein [Bacillota bacterium]